MIEIGTMTVPSQTSLNNHTTAIPFDIPNWAQGLYFESDTDAVMFEIGAGTGTNFDTFATTLAKGAPLYDARDAYVTEGIYPIPQIGMSPIQGTAAKAWVIGTPYIARDRVSANGNLYECSIAGTSAGGGSGPSGNFNQVDGTVTWLWRGPSLAVAPPEKSIVRVAMFNNAPTTATIRVWSV